MTNRGLHLTNRILLILFALVAGLVMAPAVTASATPAAAGWSGTWTTSAQAPHAVFGPNWSTEGFADQTVRQIVRISDGGSAVRIRLSNVYGTAPLRLTGATVARAADGAAVLPNSLRQLTFGHARGAVVRPGRELTSDAARLTVRPLDRLTVTLYFAGPTGPATFHSDARATSFRAAGDHRSDPGAAAFTETTASWYYLSGVEVPSDSPRRDTVVAFGDSITDGALSTQDADNRYPDELAERLHGRLGVLNAGIGGNRVLNDGSCFGEDAVSRFGRDALDQPGVRTVIVLEGINDIGSSEIEFECFEPNPRVTAQELIAGHRALIRQAHAKGVRIIGATLLPFKGAGYFSERGEAVRDELNTWIRTSGEYDAVVDLDRALADPADVDLLRPEFDSGDHLHPNDAGYHAMAAAIDLRLL